MYWSMSVSQNLILVLLSKLVPTSLPAKHSNMDVAGAALIIPLLKIAESCWGEFAWPTTKVVSPSYVSGITRWWQIYIYITYIFSYICLPSLLRNWGKNIVKKHTHTCKNTSTLCKSLILIYTYRVPMSSLVNDCFTDLNSFPTRRILVWFPT